MNMDISKLVSAIRVEESDTDVYVYVGYIRICSLEEEDGRWFAKVNGSPMLSIFGFASKQDALDAVVKNLTD
jgi:hypothetical protein